MPEGCPSNSQLDAFVDGALSSPHREGVAAHVSECPRCSGRIGQVVAKISLSNPTHFDSPAAFRRRISPPSMLGLASDLAVSPDGDTHISGEKTLPQEQLGKGSTLSRYVVLEQLGKGGMGEVYAAYDPDLDRKVAVKLLRSDFAGSGAADELRMRMLREAQAMAKLAHPNVVTVHDVGLIDERVFIAMEFVEGLTVTAWLTARARSWPAVLDTFIQAGKGLAAAHAAGLTHRDFKPDNVVVSKSGRVRVVDFGLAHAQANVPQSDSNPTPELQTDSGSGQMKRRITQPGTVLGTPAYMAPEQLLGQATDQRSDQFSYCVSLYEALYGERPFAGETAPALVAEIQANRVRPPPRDSAVPGRIRKLLLRGLRADPTERFRSLNALLVRLERRRSAVVRQWIGVAAIAVAGLVSAAFYVQHQRAAQHCVEAADRFRGVWDDQAREQAREAFVATRMPWSKKAYEAASRLLDAYTERWRLMRKAVCEEEGAADERLGQTLLCLSRAHSEAAAVARLFVRADADIVERATATALGLPPLDACAARTRAEPLPAESESETLALAEARALIDAGKYEAARKALLPLVATSPRAALLDAIALLRLGDLPQADARLEDAILAAEAVRADETLARAWTERVGVAALRRQTADAERWAKFARAALDRVRGGDELEALYQNNVGVLAWSRGDYTAAIDAHTRALVLRQRALGPDHPVLARSLSNLGIALRAAGRLPEAIERYKEAQALEERVLDPSHPAVAETLNNLGNALASSGDRPGAIAALQRSVDLKERAFGADSQAAAVGLTNLGVLLLQDGQLEEASKRLQRSLEIKEKRAGPEALTTALTLSNLAVLEEKRANHTAALSAAERALKIRRAKLGADHAELANDLLTQAQALLGLGRKRDAVKPLEEVTTLKGVDEALLAEAKALLKERANVTR